GRPRRHHAVLLGVPLVHQAAGETPDAHEAPRAGLGILGRRLPRRYHGLEEGQRHSGSHAAQDRPARNKPFGCHGIPFYGSWKRKAGLVTRAEMSSWALNDPPMLLPTTSSSRHWS